MSYQQRHYHGRHDFRKYPTIDMDPPPGNTWGENVKYFVKEGNHSFLRLKQPTSSKIYECPVSRKKFSFPDNYLEHKKMNTHLLGGNQVVDFQHFISAHDGKTFSRKENLKMHDKIHGIERRQDSEVKRRLALDARLDFEEPLQDFIEKKRQERSAKKFENLKQRQEKIRKQVRALDYGLVWGYKPEFAHYDDFETDKLQRKPVKEPVYRGWTHTNNADSWFLESHTPSAHDDYMTFYLDCLNRQYPAPKLWDSVFPAQT